MVHGSKPDFRGERWFKPTPLGDQRLELSGRELAMKTGFCSTDEDDGFGSFNCSQMPLDPSSQHMTQAVQREVRVINKDDQMRIEARGTAPREDVALRVDVVVIEDTTNVVLVHGNGCPKSVTGVLSTALRTRVCVPFGSVGMDFKVIDGTDFVAISSQLHHDGCMRLRWYKPATGALASVGMVVVDLDLKGVITRFGVGRIRIGEVLFCKGCTPFVLRRDVFPNAGDNTGDFAVLAQGHQQRSSQPFFVPFCFFDRPAGGQVRHMGRLSVAGSCQFGATHIGEGQRGGDGCFSRFFVGIELRVECFERLDANDLDRTGLELGDGFVTLGALGFGQRGKEGFFVELIPLGFGRDGHHAIDGLRTSDQSSTAGVVNRVERF